MKKLLSVCLCVVTLLGVLSVAPLEVCATEAQSHVSTDFLSDSVGGDDYPYSGVAAGVYYVDQWNFYQGECTSFCAWRLNNNNGVGFTNWYGGVRWGNAHNWDDAARSLGITVDSTPAVGAIAYWEASSSSSAGHVAWVSNVYDTTIDIEEYNYGWVLINGEYHGNHRYNSRNIARTNPSGYIHIKDLNTISFSPVDIGTGFYANIVNLASDKTLAVSGSNVVLSPKNGDENQKWRFERQNDLSYKIINQATGACLDVAGGNSANNTNIQVYESNDTNAQRWYFKAVGSGYSLVPKNATGSAADITDGVTADGTNIQLFQQNASNAQIFGLNTQPSFNALNIGNKFTAKMIHTQSSAVVSQDVGNVLVKDNTDEETWLFEQMADRSYKITNLTTGLCMDVKGGSSAEGTSIQLYESNNTQAQRFFVRKNQNGYSFIPKCSVDKAVDLWGGYNGDKNDIAISQFSDGNTNQIYSLKYYLSPDFTDSFNGHTYELYNTVLPWKEAYEFCEKQGGHLVTIDSQQEQNYILGILEHSTFDKTWLGATDVYNEGKWKWITGEEIKYNNWADGEPNDSNDEDYMMIYQNSGAWNDVSDIHQTTAYTYSFICEYDNIVEEPTLSFETTFTFKNHRYEVYSNNTDWQTAKRFCEKKGGHLLTISSAEENAAVVDGTGGLSLERYWIGFSDVKHEGKWEWITDEKVSYSNWSSGEPNNDNDIEDYAEINVKSGKWNDLGGYFCCHLTIGFICEYDTITIVGDTNLDGTVDVTDATRIQMYAAGLSDFTAEQLAVADVNGDGVVDVTDATRIQMYAAGLIDKF